MMNGLDWLFTNPFSYIVIPVAIEQKNDIIKDIILPLIPSVLTIWGWRVIYKQEIAARNEQKEILEQDIARQKKEERLQKVLLHVNEIKELSFKYYQLDASDIEAIELGLIIQARLKQLNHFITRACCENQVVPAPIRTKFIKFRRTLTGGSFGSAQRLAIPITDIIYPQIITAELNLYLEIEQLLP